MKLSRMLMLFGILLGVFLSVIAVIVLLGLPSPPDEEYYSIANFDYVIPRPGDAQVNDLKAQSFIEEVIPYYNYSATISDQPVNIYLIEGDSSYTPFGDGYLLKGSNDLTSSSVIVDASVASIFGWNIDDVITLDIEGSSIQFSIIGISIGNKFSKRPSMAILFDGLQKSIICSQFERLSYSGAFVSVSDRSLAESYFTYTYVPEGKIGNLSWYENEELYQYAQDSISSSPAIFEIIDIIGLKAEEISAIKAYENDVKQLAYISNFITSSICIIAWLLLFIILRPSITKSFMMGYSYKKIVRISCCSEFLSLVIPLLVCNAVLLNYGFIDALVFNFIPVINYIILLILSRMILIPRPKKTESNEAIRNSQPCIDLSSTQGVNDVSKQRPAEKNENGISNVTSTDSEQGTVLADEQNNSENEHEKSVSNSSIKTDE